MRHIPSCDTAHAGVLSFENALKPTCADFDRSRWLYVPDHYSEYRYLLGTKGQRPLVCIGINPSTAVPDRLDNTLKSGYKRRYKFRHIFIIIIFIFFYSTFEVSGSRLAPKTYNLNTRHTD